MTLGPPGFIPGFHHPGTLIPMGYIAEQERLKRQREADTLAAAAAADRRRRCHLSGHR